MSRDPDGADDVIARPSPEIPGRFDAVVPDVRLRGWMAGRMIDGYWAMVDGEDPVWKPPPHIHVRSGDGIAAYWLEPVSLRAIVVASRETMVRQWNDFFGQISDQPPDRGRG